jgi:AraC-like DNA-binding protein
MTEFGRAIPGNGVNTLFTFSELPSGSQISEKVQLGNKWSFCDAMMAKNLRLRLVRLKPTDEWFIKGDEIFFIFPKGGAGSYVSKVLTHSLLPGDVLVLNGASGGKLCFSNGDELVFWFFCARLEHLFPLFETNEISLLRNVTADFNGTKLYPASSTLARDCHRLLGEAPPQFDLDHRGQLLRVVAAILTAEFKTVHTQRGGYIRIEEHMIQVFEKLSANEILTLSVGQLASKFNCSRRHLNRLFHQHFSFSVASLRMEMRLSKAVSLLRDPDTKIIDVAEECLFNHLGLFNTCFKRRFGKTPGEWRKMKGGGDVADPARDGSFANYFRTKGLSPSKGKIEDRHRSTKVALPALKSALTIVIKTNLGPDESRALRDSAPRKAREGVRRNQAL